MIDTGKAFCVANKQFMNGIRDLAQYSSNDAVVETSLTKFSDSLQEMINFHTEEVAVAEVEEVAACVLLHPKSIVF
uniref:arf-GAP with coiled-coil, ANK repeat and PH domain-containing protein 2-like n=1 Tax=Halichoerus grypus TaxID=9711 RepID=UPI0016597777|nr:arf-GAP with coiled-coil, ANK repeat and PH domain-containing protein 2-like [Halichoerus grypus]